MSASNLVVLISSDGETFEVEESVAIESKIIKNLMDDGCANTPIPMPNVTAKILALIIEYCKRHVEVASNSNSDSEAPRDKDFKAFDAEFIKVDQHTLFDLLVAANYLDIKSLLDLTCQAVADMISGMSTEEIRMAFNIQNDYTQEEEEEVMRENAWAFESREMI